jgi:iron(III) transport system substrate-binding protein
MRARLTALPALAVTLLLLAACGSSATSGSATAGGSSSSGYAKYAKLTGAERTKTLLADAKKEGSLQIYTSNTDIGDLVDAFKKTYPGIKVSSYRANSETVLQRALQEGSAHKTSNDVMDTNDYELDVLNGQHLLTNYTGPSAAGLRAGATYPGWVAERFNAFVVGWNTQKLPGGKPPTSLQELAGPKWRGLISMELGDWDWYLAIRSYLKDKKGMTDPQLDTLFRGLASNAKVTKGHTVQGDLLSSGQFAVALSAYSHTIDKAKKKGAPVEWRPAVQPVILRPNGVALMATPKHPAAALLWMDWVLNQGQQIIAKSKRIPARENVPGFKDPVPAGTQIYQISQQQLQSQNKKWQDAYDVLLRGKKAVGGDG